MKPAGYPLRNAPAVLLALTAAFFSVFFSSLTGCMGGTTTGAENPSLTLEFRENGDNVAVEGAIQIYVAGSNPEFYNDVPDDGSYSKPRADIETQVHIDALGFPASKTLTLTRDEIAMALHQRPVLRLQKTSATRTLDSFPDFNIVLIGNGGKMSLLAGIHMDPATGTFSTVDGAPGENLIVPVSLERDYSGKVDTGTAAGKPLALFVPGTNFYAQVSDDAFTFQGVPAGKMPIRWVSANGDVREMADSLGGAWTKPLRPGDKVASIELPAPMIAVQVPTATPPGHYAFTDSVMVSLVSESGSSIYYTLDGTTPTTTSKAYTNPLILRSSSTLKAVAYIKGRNHSAISVNNYTLVPAQPVASPAGTGFRDSIVVALSDQSSGTVVRYSLDGSEPGSAGTVYTHPIVLRASTTLKAVGVSGLGESRLLEEKYILLTDSLPAAPVTTPSSQSFSDSLRVLLNTSTPKAIIYFTLDGSDPGTNSPSYSGPLLIGATTTLKAVAYVPGMGLSPIRMEKYVLVLDTLPIVPIATPPSGTYADTLAITLATSTPGATIFYTVDGSAPTTGGTLYSGGALVFKGSLTPLVTIKAAAYKAGKASPILTAIYTITSHP